MPVRTFNLFISHSWSHGDAYHRLISLLNQRPYFHFKDYSVPKHNPIHNAPTVTRLREAIKNQMQPCSAILIPAGIYASHSKWINKEIDLAKNGFSSPKPIIAIKPRGSKRRSVGVQKVADKIVGWNTDSIVKAIRELG